MNVVNFNERACERYRRYFDAYLDNELLVETNQEVLHHLNSCAECTKMLDDRSRVKQRVKQAVTAEIVPTELAAAVRSGLRTDRRGFFASNTARWMMAAAAVLLLAIVGAGGLWWSKPGLPAGDDNVFQALSTRAQNLIRVGLVDHIHCAIVSKQWKRFLSLEEMEAGTGPSALGPQFIGLVPAVEAKLGSDYKLVQAHRCVANQRRYIHLILTGNQGAIVSLVITEKNNESFNQSEMVEVIRASGIPIYRARQGSLEVAGFESDKYLAFVVSNLDRATNLNVSSLVAPVVYNHLHGLEL
jgi:anti-sigma factor RsiW